MICEDDVLALRGSAGEISELGPCFRDGIRIGHATYCTLHYRRMAVCPRCVAREATAAHLSRHAAAAVLPYVPGVYRFRDERGRVLYIGPLPYTGTRLSGSERDMARQRGVGQADRSRLGDLS
jgi:hypothetical protein